MFSMVLFFWMVLVVPINPKPSQRIYRPCKDNQTCVDIWRCSYYMDILKRTSGPLSRPTLTMVRKNFCGTVNQNPKVCCEMDRSTEQVVTSTIATINRDLSQHPNYKLLGEDCGGISKDFRIMDGINAKPAEFPWMVLIAYESEIDDDFKCGGSLINERYVLTAAHCIKDSIILGVRLGEFDVMTVKDCDRNGQNCQPPIDDITHEKVLIHPDFDENTLFNDIALIKLSKPANLAKSNIKPICLPFGDSQNTVLIGKHLTVTGWGITETGYHSAILRKVAVPVVPLKECQRIYNSSKKIIGNGQICAGGYKGRDSCAGDSGGPLQVIENSGEIARYVQYGIVSYGPVSCGVEGIPGVYTDVRKYLEWILDNLEEEEILENKLELN